MEFRPRSERDSDLKVMFLSRDSLLWMLMDTVPITKWFFYYIYCFCLPRMPCFFLQEYPSCAEPSVECLSYITYFSYWSQTIHSAIVWQLVTCSLESAHFPASFPFPLLLPPRGFIMVTFFLFSREHAMPFMTEYLCTCCSLSHPTPPLKL